MLNKHRLTDRASWVGDGATASGSGRQRETHPGPVEGQASAENLELLSSGWTGRRVQLETKGLKQEGDVICARTPKKKKKMISMESLGWVF